MTTGIVAVDELALAYRAAVNGEFRNGHRHATTPTAARGQHLAATWEPAPAEQVVLVAGSMGSAGTSTVALAVASCAASARVVECCTVASSGLAAASSAELGMTVDGWVQGSRGEVLIERRGDRVPSVDLLPSPAPTSVPVTVLDCSWDLDLLVASGAWLGDLARTLPAVAVVTRPTIPGMRRLEVAIALLGEHRVHAVVVGVDRRWPRQVEQAMGAATRRLRSEGRLTGVPSDPQLATAGVTPDPLPAAVLAACSDLLTVLKGTR
ncbi:MAG: hypothetical protein CVT65_00590 [Actinobacteria bacterium HGW-Actinobacteria-5]|jgi:hypothetical protein|nr:MAG: hypothetical protein CVT65_00590 [Actinobacteria bacterium HGW-Actinobacteria-5]